MSLLLTFLLLAVSLTVILWAMALVIQPYLYSDPVEKAGWRALGSGVVLAAFLTFWTMLNTRADVPDKYGTFFEFNPTASKDVNEFEAVRRLPTKGPDGNYAEETVAFKRVPGRVPAEFVEVANPSHKYQVNTSNYMTIALLVPDGAGNKTRYNADMDARGLSYKAPEKTFREQGGNRYLDGTYPGTAYAPNNWAVMGALLLNLLQFVLWFAVFWPVMRYSSGMALGLAGGFGLLTMLMVMPLLFEKNRVHATPTAVVGAK